MLMALGFMGPFAKLKRWGVMSLCMQYKKLNRGLRLRGSEGEGFTLGYVS